MKPIDNNYNKNISFSANLLISGKRDLLNSNQINKLNKMVQSIGLKDDIAEFNIASDIIDWVEVNKNNEPKKFLSGYKMSVETTINGFEYKDLSVADTQQRFWYDYDNLSPFGVLTGWIKSIEKKMPYKNGKININPDIYNSLNNNWHNWASIVTPDEVPNNITAKKSFINSPFYKAFIGKKDTSLAAVFNDNLTNNSHRINIEQLSEDVSDLKSGLDIKAPVLDFTKGIVHPKSQEIKSSKYVFIDGLQTQFSEIEELADLIIRMKVPENVRTERFIDRAAQLGTSTEQSQKDLKASNEYMEKLIPFNPESADVTINGRYNKDDLFKFLQKLFDK